jgi:hypothetical protein
VGFWGPSLSSSRQKNRLQHHREDADGGLTASDDQRWALLELHGNRLLLGRQLEFVQGEEIPSHLPVLSRGRECCASIVRLSLDSDCQRGDRSTVSLPTLIGAVSRS